MMRIALYHGPLFRADHGYESYGPYVRYIHEFAKHFEEVVVLAPVARSGSDYRGCRIMAKNVRVVELPDFRTHVQAALHCLAIRRVFKREIDGLDVINCRHTAPLGSSLYRLAHRRGIGFFYHFSSAPWEVLRVGPKYGGLYGCFARAAYSIGFQAQKRVMRRTYSFVNGRGPCEHLRQYTDRVEPVISSSLLPSDFRNWSAAVLHDPVRLLYVGYLKHMKGLGYLLEALARLGDQPQGFELHLVGAGPEENALRRDVAERGLTGKVHFHGYVPMGDALTRHYDEADIFVFPSLSEGSPRVVLEALARSLPVISTKVGSVPEVIEDGRSGLLIAMQDAGAIASAVSRFVDDDPLRHRCVSEGFKAARSHTVQRYLAPLIAKAKELARKKGRDA